MLEMLEILKKAENWITVDSRNCWLLQSRARMKFLGSINRAIQDAVIYDKIVETVHERGV